MGVEVYHRMPTRVPSRMRSASSLLWVEVFAIIITAECPLMVKMFGTLAKLTFAYSRIFAPLQRRSSQCSEPDDFFIRNISEMHFMYLSIIFHHQALSWR